MDDPPEGCYSFIRPRPPDVGKVSIVRRDTGEKYEEFLTRLAKESGVETPTREDLIKLDRKRKNKASNDDWKSPNDPDARITKMKDGSTHLAHKAEHAVDMDSGAVLSVTLQHAELGDTTTIYKTVTQATENLEKLAQDPLLAEKLKPYSRRGGDGQGLSQQQSLNDARRRRDSNVHQRAGSGRTERGE